MNETVSQNPMKLFVWEDVLHDYTSGMAFAIAESKDKAISQIAENISPGMSVGGFMRSHPDFLQEPKVLSVSEPCAFHVYGGA